VRVVLILAVLLPLAAVVGWFVSRPILAAQQRRRRIAALEEENERLDALLKRESEQDES
jgi:lipopolysaccharide biosynthesis regulator YciM